MQDIPSRDCTHCPRLVQFRETNRVRYPNWHNAPVPSFGQLDAQILIVGLAPGLEGANCTGRPFTGDWAGDLLYATLLKYGFARGDYQERADDGLELLNCRITNAVRCVPPQNKPTTVEIKTCRPYLVSEIGAMPHLRVLLALGRIAHEQVLSCLGEKSAAYPFAHGGVHQIGKLKLLSSYHCSRYNTNTGRLTVAMFERVIEQARDIIASWA